LKRTIFLLAAVTAVVGVVAITADARGNNDETAAPVFGVKIPSGYRGWKLVSVAHEQGDLNDLRAILGNETAIKAYRDKALPFPDGTMIARLSWSYISSEENNKAFGRYQSFVAGPPINVQFMVKDSGRYGETGGWGFAQFKDGKPADEKLHKTCFACHQSSKAQDYLFTHYAP